MSEEITETLPPIGPESSKASWDAAMAKNNVRLANDGGISMQQQSEESAPVVEKESVVAHTNGTAPETDEEFPSELITGKPAVETPSEDPDALFKEAPKGPVKHEHFERVQKKALEEVTRARAELEQLRAEAAKTKPSDQLSPELVKQMEDLKAEREQLLERLGQADYARTPEFESKFTVKEQQIATALTETVEAAGADKDLVSSLLHVGIKKRMEMLDNAEITPSAKSRIDALLVRYDEVQSDKVAELANWKSKSAARQQQQQAEQQARAAQEEKEYDTAFDEISKELFETEPFRIIAGQDKWNAVAEKNRANARELLKGGLSAKAVVRGGIHAAGYETLLGMFRKVQATAKSQAAEIAKLRGNSPLPASRAPNEKGGADTSKMSDSEAARYHFNKAMGRT